MNDPYHYVAILGSTNKTAISRIGNWISVMSRGKGQAPLRVRDTLAMPQDPTLILWNLQGRSSLTFEEWQFLNTRFPVLTDLYPRRLVSNNHTGEKYINVRASRSLTPP